MTNAAFLFGVPIVIGMAVGLTLFAIYQSWQDQEERGHYERGHQHREREQSNPSRRSVSSSGGTAYRRAISPRDNNCSICLEDNKVNVQSLGCGHTFHTTCLTLLAGHGSKLCPNCRKPFDL